MLEALADNTEFAFSPLYFYCDGGRNGAELAQVEETRKQVMRLAWWSASWWKSSHCTVSSENVGEGKGA
jgi:hypothetical protein